MSRLLREPPSLEAVRRFYIYQWDGDPGFDSGLINPASRKRRATYYQYKRRIP